MHVFLILIFLFFFFPSKAFSSEVSLIDHKKAHQGSLKKANLKATQGTDMINSSDLKVVEDFISQEDERVKDIKLMTLDVEKADLQLIQKEISMKLAQLGKTEGLMPQALLEKGQQPPPRIKINSLVISQGFKEALISLEGVGYTAREGDTLAGSLTIKSIGINNIQVRYLDGKDETIFINP
jgi:hypothetical protein